MHWNPHKIPTQINDSDSIVYRILCAWKNSNQKINIQTKIAQRVSFSSGEMIWVEFIQLCCHKMSWNCSFFYAIGLGSILNRNSSWHCKWSPKYHRAHSLLYIHVDFRRSKRKTVKWSVSCKQRRDLWIVVVIYELQNVYLLN